MEGRYDCGGSQVSTVLFDPGHDPVSSEINHDPAAGYEIGL